MSYARITLINSIKINSKDGMGNDYEEKPLKHKSVFSIDFILKWFYEFKMKDFAFRRGAHGTS